MANSRFVIFFSNLYIFFILICFNCPHAVEAWICISRDHWSDIRQIHNTQAGGKSGLGEETGQMNSTCRGEGEGLNCKTRRQRSCALKACRQKRCFWGGGGGWGGICTLGMWSSYKGVLVLRTRGWQTASSPRVQSDSRESSQLRGYRSARTVARTKENT